MIANLFVGLLVVGLGFAAMYFSSSLVQFFGRSSRADRNLGGTRNMIVLVGFGTMLIGFLFMFGVFDVSTVQQNAIDSNITPQT